MHGGKGTRGLPYGIDRRHVALIIEIGVLLRLRRLAQHVVGKEIALGLVLLGARQGLADRAAQHELIAEDLHRLADGLPDNGLAGAGDEALDGVDGIGAARVLELDDATGEQERPGRGVDEKVVGVAEVALPAPAGDLLGDKLVGGVAVGNPEQRLGDAHQDDAFLAGKPVLAHEGIDAGVLGFVGARGMDEAASDVGGAPTLLLGKHRALDQTVEQPRLVDEMVRRYLVARRQRS